MNNKFIFKGIVEKFPGFGGWHYVLVPNKYRKKLKVLKTKWGMFPIRVKLGSTSWKTKLMTKSGGDFFVALKASVRKKEEVLLGDRVMIILKLE